MTKDEALKLALEALEDSVDMVRHEYETDWRHGMPTRKAQLDGMKQALDQHEKAITASKEALAQPTSGDYALGYGEGFNDACKPQPEEQQSCDKQEPVSWGVDWSKDGDIPCAIIIKRLPDGGMEVVAMEYGPPQRPWVGLTDEEKQEWIDAMPYDIEPRHCMILVNVIEAKLKEKNTCQE